MHLQRPLSNAKCALDNFHFLLPFILLLLLRAVVLLLQLLCVCQCCVVCQLLPAWQRQLPLPFTVNVLTLTVCFSCVWQSVSFIWPYPVSGDSRLNGYTEADFQPRNLVENLSLIFSLRKRFFLMIFSLDFREGPILFSRI